MPPLGVIHVRTERNLAASVFHVGPLARRAVALRPATKSVEIVAVKIERLQHRDLRPDEEVAIGGVPASEYLSSGQLLRFDRCPSRLWHILPLGMLGLNPGNHVHADHFAEHLATPRVDLPDVAFHAIHVRRIHRPPGQNRDETIFLFVQYPVAPGKPIRSTGVGASDRHVHSVGHGFGDLLVFDAEASALVSLKPFDFREGVRKRNCPILALSRNTEHRQDRQERIDRNPFHCVES